MPQANPGKPRVVTVRRDIRTVVFERHRSQVGILNQIPATVCLPAEIPKERPVGGFGSNGLRRWRGKSRVNECLDRVARAWWFEDGGMRRDPQDGLQHRLEQPDGFGAVQRILQPGVIFVMTLAVLAEGIEEDVDIGRDHRRPSMRS